MPANHKLQYAEDYQWYLQSWPEKYKTYTRQIKGRDVKFKVNRGVSFKRALPFQAGDDAEADFEYLKRRMTELPKADHRKSYLHSVEFNTRQEYNLGIRSNQKSRINSFSALDLLLTNKSISEQFALPQNVEDWMNEVANMDIDRWLQYIEYIPDVPDFGLSEKIEAEINKALQAAEGLNCEETL